MWTSFVNLFLNLLLFIYTVSTLYMEFKVWRRKKAKAAKAALR